jgi:hypothetical protein
MLAAVSGSVFFNLEDLISFSSIARGQQAYADSNKTDRTRSGTAEPKPHCGKEERISRPRSIEGDQIIAAQSAAVDIELHHQRLARRIEHRSPTSNWAS